MNSNLASPKMKKSMAGRGGSGRPRSKTPQNSGPAQHQAFVGLYQNERLVNSVTSVLGCIARVTGKSGQQFEGVFKTISSEGSVVLSKAGPVGGEHQNGVVEKVLQRQDTFEQLVVNKKDWVTVEFKDVDLEECHTILKKDTLKTVNAINKKQNGPTEKELEKWVSKGEEDGSLATLGLEVSNTVQTNGWSATEMFALNEQKYGVKSTYNESMEEYTTKLEKSDTPEYREKEKIAAQKAEEIIKESPFERNMLDSGRSEETLYSSVVRNKYERPTQQNWRNHTPDRPDRDQRSQKVQRESSNSPAMTKKEPMKTAQSDEVERMKVKEIIAKPEVESSVESKPEINVDVSVDAVKDSKPLQNVSSMKPEPSATKAVLDQVTPKVPVEANEATESPAVSRKSPVATPPPVEQNRKLVTKELKEFGHNFKLPDKKVKENTEGKSPVEDDEKLSKEKKKVEKEEPQPAQKTKVASEQSSEEKKVKSALNPHAQEFQPSPKPSNSSPISSASSGGTPSPYTNPYPVSPYPPGGVYNPRHMQRGRARGDYMEHPSFMNASSAAGQPFFAQPPHITQFVPQPHANIGPFMSPPNMRHPGMQHFLLPAVQHGQGGPMVVPMGPGPYGEGVYYSPPVQMIQSPPQITSPSLQQHQFNFPQPMALTAQPVNTAVRPVGPAVIPQQPRQTPVVLMRPQTSGEMQAPQIMAQNRQPPTQNFQGN